MDDEKYKAREHERAIRLIKFVENEIRNMYFQARYQFTIELFNFLMPEIKVLLEEHKIDVPK